MKVYTFKGDGIRRVFEIADAVALDTVTVGGVDASASARFQGDRVEFFNTPPAANATVVIKVFEADEFDLPVATAELSIDATVLGLDQATAYQLTKEVNRIGFGEVVVGVTDSIKLPPTVLIPTGSKLVVINGGADAAKVFPYLGDDIDFAGVNVAYSLSAFDFVTFIKEANGRWRKF